MTEICYFIETGKLPTQGDTSAFTASKTIGEDSTGKRKRGFSLLDMREVGYYDEENKKIHRRPIVPGSCGYAKRG
ncbi:hypothetical protein M9H77_13849 [Catharanthus roseus]|uniref:Uncharacterized protein n=1 Tax=Catharanthus roseus TaxID=4058 RepID=A0ACC0BLI8_CATRO|nr:hypothetical protein M9H77_13849 [Catharanthus roseus]